MSEPTTVVHLLREQWDVLIDRRTRWGNPFKIGPHGTREDVIRKYEEWIQTRAELLAALPSLRGKRLGCWCKPLACHGDVLARLADQEPEPLLTFLRNAVAQGGV